MTTPITITSGSKKVRVNPPVSRKPKTTAEVVASLQDEIKSLQQQIDASADDLLQRNRLERAKQTRQTMLNKLTTVIEPANG